MKQLVLVLLLLVAVSSTEVPKESNDIKEYIEIVKCFLNQENLVNDVVSLVDIIKSGEYDKLLSLAFKLYTDGSAAVKECITKDEINLEGIRGEPELIRLETKEEIEIMYKDTNDYIDDYFTSKKQINKELCEKACRLKYVGYQLEMCISLCILKYVNPS